MNKKGDFTGILVLLVSIAAFAFFLVIVGYVVIQITPPLQENLGTVEGVNETLQAGQNVAENTFNTIWLIMFGGLFLGLLITAFLIPSHPVFIPIFGILLLIVVFIAIPISNAYTSFIGSADIEDVAYHYGFMSWIVERLPMVMFIIGVIIFIIAYAKPGGGSYVPA